MRNAAIAVIGGGAAGLSAAVRAARRYPGQKIVVLEKADRVGKKILVSGNGRCNLSNLHAAPAFYHGKGAETVTNILFKKYSPAYVLDFFEEIGLMTKADSEGRVYPLSNSSATVLNVVLAELERRHVEILCDSEALSISADTVGRNGFIIKTAHEEIRAEKLIISVGGKADHANRATDNTGLFEQLGLTLVKTSPSLSPVAVKSELLKSLKGIRAAAKVTLLQNGRTVKSETGEVQFSENALSGICVFNLSRFANTHDNCEISISLLPGHSSEEVHTFLEKRIRRAADQGENASSVLNGMFHTRIDLAVLKAAGIHPSKNAAEITQSEAEKLARTVVDWRFRTVRKSDMKNAQVTAGGVSLHEIDPHTFACGKHPGLFLIGEALDVDGDCGGYNLQFAFASGLCAGDNI